MTQTTGIEDRSLLVRLSISQWQNRIADEKVVKIVADTYNLQKVHNTYVKKLVPDEALRPINRAANALRQHHHANSLPWQDNNVRIISAGSLFDYQQGYAPLRAKFDAAVQDLLDNYADWVNKGKEMQRELFDPAQYPGGQELKTKFNVRLSFMPFPKTSANDFRIQGVSEEEAERIRAQAQSEIATALRRAGSHLLNMLDERLNHLIYLGEKGLLNTTHMESLREIVSTIRRLNFNEDERVNSVLKAYHGMYLPEEVISKTAGRNLVLRLYEMKETVERTIYADNS